MPHRLTGTGTGTHTHPHTHTHTHTHTARKMIKEKSFQRVHSELTVPFLNYTCLAHPEKGQKLRSNIIGNHFKRDCKREGIVRLY